MMSRTVCLAVKLVCENGGRVMELGGKKYLVITTKAEFNAPLEFCVVPMPRMEVGCPVDYRFSCAANENYAWSLVEGSLPEGVTFDNVRITGTPLRAGKYPVTLSLSDGKKNLSKRFELLVRTKNIAPEADSILTNIRTMNDEVLYKCWITFGKPMYAHSVDVIRD